MLRRVILAQIFLSLISVEQILADEPKVISTATGIAVSQAGMILTNNHAVAGCGGLVVRLPDATSVFGRTVFADAQNDLAFVTVPAKFRTFASFRLNPAIRSGESVVALGYPLAEILSPEVNVSTGIVSALGGVRGDSRYLQISAPVQPGNSGGPLFDEFGQVIGVVAAKLDAIAVAGMTGDIPQNINFAIKASVVSQFSERASIPLSVKNDHRKMSVSDLAERGKNFTVRIDCLSGAQAAKVTMPQSPNKGPNYSPADRPPIPAVGTVITTIWRLFKNGQDLGAVEQNVQIISHFAGGFTAIESGETTGMQVRAYFSSNPFAGLIYGEVLNKKTGESATRYYEYEGTPDEIFPLTPGKKVRYVALSYEHKDKAVLKEHIQRSCVVGEVSQRQTRIGPFNVIRVTCETLTTA